MAERNPAWARDEQILALDLYLRLGAQSRRHPDVVELSDFLNSLPLHSSRPDVDRFRNPSGVALKMANFAALDPAFPGVGMRRGSQADAEVWEEFHRQPDELRRLASAIRAAAVTVSPTPVDDEEERPEGRLLYRWHRTYERDARLVEKKKAAVFATGGTLACEACGFDFGRAYGTLGQGYIECHHLRPLHATGPRRTRLNELALLCANCHRMAHRARPWPSVDDLRRLLEAGA